MTPTSKIIGAVVLLALLGTTAFVLSTDDGNSAKALPIATSNPSDLIPRSSEELASPDEAPPEKEAITARTAQVKPVEETREQKRARKRAAGPFLKGRILDAFNNPIEGALVEFSSWQASAQGMMLAGMGGGNGAPKESSKNTVKTDAEGRFSAYRDPKFGLDVSISIGARGFLVEKERELLGDDGTLELGDYHLKPGAIIAGIVVNQDNEPVEGAKIRRTDKKEGGMLEIGGMFLEEFGMGGLTGGNLTDEAGRFELPHEQPGEFMLTIKHDDYPLTEFEGETGPVGTAPIQFVVQMKPSASIEGTLAGLPPERDKIHIYARAIGETEESDSLAGMFGELSMYSGSPNSKVEPDGKFKVSGLTPGGRYELRAIEKGGMFQRKPCSEAVKASAGDLTVNLNFDPGASLSFNVVDALTGDPITQLDVKHTWADGSDMFAAVAASFNGSEEEGYPGGRVVLTELRPKDDPGMLELRISSPGYLDFGRDDISISVDADVDIGTIRLQGAPRVRVHVVSAKTGKPVPRARVRLRNGSGGIFDAMQDASRGVEVNVSVGSAADMSELFDSKTVSGKTDTSGWCEMPAFEMNEAVLSVRSPKYSDYEKEELRVKSIGTTTFEVSLVRGGEVEVQVLDGSNRPVPGAVVRHRGPDGEYVDSKTTNKKGQARFRRVLPGPHSFMAKHDSNNIRGMFGNVNFGSSGDDDEEEEDWMTIGVVDGETSRLKLTAPGFCTLEGVVTSNGAPLIGATLSLTEEEDADEALERIGGRVGRMLASGGLTDVSNDRGRYQISSIPAGEYSLVIRHEDRAMPSVLKVKLHEGENRFDATLALTSLEGRVVDANGDPVMGAKLDVLKGETSVEQMNATARLDGPMSEFFGDNSESGPTTGSDGSFTIHGVQPDTPIFVVARKDGYSTGRSQSVTVKEGELETGLDIELLSSGSILVRVSSEARPFSMIQGVFQGETKEGESVGTKLGFVRNGKAVLKDLRAGPWKVRFSDDDDDENAQIVNVEAGQQSITELAEQ